MKNFISISIFSLLLLPNLIAQGLPEIEKIQSHAHYLGLAGGGTTGYGLSYRFWPGKLGGQATALFVKDSQTNDFNVGLTALYKLIDDNNLTFFLYQGNQYSYIKSKSEDYNALPKFEVEKSFNHGLGFGLEFTVLKHIGLDLMVGYGAFDNFRRIGLTGEAGAFFKF